METFEVSSTVYFMLEAENADDAVAQVEFILNEIAHDWTEPRVEA